MSRNVKLSQLIRESEGQIDIVSQGRDRDITSVEYDSRKVSTGSLFVAVEGFESDGHLFVSGAIDAGAAAILVSRGREDEFDSLGSQDLSILVSSNTRKALSILSASFYGHPTRNMVVIGITGTNGKTSITYMLESIMRNHGLSAGVIGTVNYRWGENSIIAHNTTPESRDLQEMFYHMEQDGVDVIIMEVSSHALELFRADDIAFNAAVFTNLTRDHLDFHDNFDNYFAAKRRLFSILEKVPKENCFGMINTDDPYGERIFTAKGTSCCPLYSYGIETGIDYRPDKKSITNTITGLRYQLEWPVKIDIDLNLAGKFHVYNSLAAFSVSHRMGIPIEEIINGLADIKTVPGRFDVLSSSAGYHVIVDYAHTVDALLKLLQSVQELKPSRIITVFGCGGDRDKTKRPLMGDVAEKYSDHVIVTSDNPRTEKPDEIIKNIVEGITGKHFEIISDREQAIRHAISISGSGDIIVIAGKGHEDYQILGDKKIHFDDKEIAAQYMEEEKK